MIATALQRSERINGTTRMMHGRTAPAGFGMEER